jgi:hypothetical protein
MYIVERAHASSALRIPAASPQRRCFPGNPGSVRVLHATSGGAARPHSAATTNCALHGTAASIHLSLLDKTGNCYKARVKSRWQCAHLRNQKRCFHPFSHLSLPSPQTANRELFYTALHVQPHRAIDYTPLNDRMIRVTKDVDQPGDG